MKYVALVQQGMIFDQKVVGEGEDEQALQELAQREADKINSQQTSESEGWSAKVLPVEL